jgi:hypothetical protein
MNCGPPVGELPDFLKLWDGITKRFGLIGAVYAPFMTLIPVILGLFKMLLKA